MSASVYVVLSGAGALPCSKLRATFGQCQRLTVLKRMVVGNHDLGAADFRQHDLAGRLVSTNEIFRCSSTGELMPLLFQKPILIGGEHA